MKTVSVLSIGVGLFLSIGSVLDPILKHSNQILTPAIIGGIFFILLGIFNEKNTYKEGGPYVAFAGAALLLMTDYIGILEGKLAIPCPARRHCPITDTVYTIKDNPREFWILFSIFLLISIGCGLYGYFNLKKSKISSPTHHSSGTPNGAP